MSTMTEEPSIKAAAGSASRTRFLHRSERAALMMSPEGISHVRLINIPRGSFAGCAVAKSSLSKTLRGRS